MYHRRNVASVLLSVLSHRLCNICDAHGEIPSPMPLIPQSAEDMSAISKFLYYVEYATYLQEYHSLVFTLTEEDCEMFRKALDANKWAHSVFKQSFIVYNKATTVNDIINSAFVFDDDGYIYITNRSWKYCRAMKRLTETCYSAIEPYIVRMDPCVLGRLIDQYLEQEFPGLKVDFDKAYRVKPGQFKEAAPCGEKKSILDIPFPYYNKDHQEDGNANEDQQQGELNNEEDGNANKDQPQNDPKYDAIMRTREPNDIFVYFSIPNPELSCVSRRHLQKILLCLLFTGEDAHLRSVLFTSKARLLRTAKGKDKGSYELVSQAMNSLSKLCVATFLSSPHTKTLTASDPNTVFKDNQPLTPEKVYSLRPWLRK